MSEDSVAVPRGSKQREMVVRTTHTPHVSQDFSRINVGLKFEGDDVRKLGKVDADTVDSAGEEEEEGDGEEEEWEDEKEEKEKEPVKGKGKKAVPSHRQKERGEKKIQTVTKGKETRRRVHQFNIGRESCARVTCRGGWSKGLQICQNPG